MTSEQPATSGWQPPRGRVYPHLLAVATMLVIEPRLGARYLSVAQWLRDFYAWPDSRRREWQERRLEDVVRHAGRHVPFYRERFGNESRPVVIGDLPVVDKARIRPDMDNFVMPNWQQQPHRDKRTGGTTGDPWRYPLDNRAWQHMYAAALHFRGRTGYHYGERIVLLGTPPSLLPGDTNWKSKLRRRLEQRVATAAGLEIDHKSSLERARAAQELDGALWYGYAGTVAAMADAVLTEGIDIRPPRAIITTAETLQPAWRERIELAFGAPLFDEYGCNDGGVLAQSCGAGRYHVADNVSIVEVLDEGGRPCPPGAEGDVTVTNLHARLLPFLRYQTGDRAVRAEGPCPCGVRGSTLARIAGRQGDRVVLPDGTELSAISFGHAFKGDDSNVRRWQVVQVNQRQMTVRLDVNPAFDTGEEEHIRNYFAARCGEEVAVAVTTAEPIEVTPGGKHKIVVRQFD